MHQKEDIVMKLKTIIATFLSSAALISLPYVPARGNPFSNLENSISITAQAADEFRGYATVNGCSYSLYFGGTGLYAVLTAVPDNITSLTIPRYVTSNKTSYAVQKIGPNACKGRNALKTVDLTAAISLYEIGARAFDNSDVKSFRNLTTVKLPNSVTTIGEYAFAGNNQLTSCNMPEQLITLSKGAFQYTALSGTISFGKRVREIEPSCFNGVTEIKAYSVHSSNTSYKAIDGVLYAYFKTSLILYPPQKTSTTYTVLSTHISNYAFYYAPNIEKLDISKPIYNSNAFSAASFACSLPKLKEVTLPDSEINKSLYELTIRYYKLFYGTKLLTVNGTRIVKETSGKEPTFDDKFIKSVYSDFPKMQNCYWYNYYKTQMVNYVLSTTITNSMTDMQKAIRLHDWIINRVEYDPVEAEFWNSVKPGQDVSDNDVDARNHIDTSIFLHYDTNTKKYYTVCDGYSMGYKLLLEKAGIDAYRVSGDNPKGGGHSWNLVKINGNYYHVDVCWDDGENTKKYFMRSDKSFNNKAVLKHTQYNWKAVENPYFAKGSNVAKYDMFDELGRVNGPTAITATTVKRLQAIVGGATPTAYERVAGDLDFNGVIDSRDLSFLKQYINTYQYSYNSVFDWRIAAYS